MPLSQAMLELADKLEKEFDKSLSTINDLNPLKMVVKFLLESYAREIRTAVKSSENDLPFAQNQLIVSKEQPVYSHRHYINQERERIRKEKEQANLDKERIQQMAEMEESNSTMLVELVGIESKDKFTNKTQVRANIKIGDAVEVMGNIFEYKEDGKLHLRG